MDDIEKDFKSIGTSIRNGTHHLMDVAKEDGKKIEHDIQHAHQ